MRGNEAPQVRLFSYVHLEDRKALRHPLRLVRRMVDQALAGLDGAFATMYATTGRPSIPPERRLRALLLQIFYKSIGSKALLIDQLDGNLLFRWFVGLAIADPVWDPSTFSKNRDRLIEADVAQGFFTQVLAQTEAKQLLSDEHFSVDGTLIEAWASHKSFQRKDGSSPPPAPGAQRRGRFPRPAPVTRPISHRRDGRRWAFLGFAGVKRSGSATFAPIRWPIPINPGWKPVRPGGR